MRRIWMQIRVMLVGVTLATLTASGVAQTRAGGANFQAASIKVSRPGSAGYGAGVLQIRPGGQLDGQSMTAAELIRVAYRLPTYALVGDPKWVEGDRFDLEAKADVDLGNPFTTTQSTEPTVLELLLRSLL